MSKVLLNARSSTAGGGLTYLRNTLPRFARSQTDNQYVAIVPESRRDEFEQFQSGKLSVQSIGGVEGRSLLSLLKREQASLKQLIRSQNIDVLVSLGNFALFSSPVPQILFNRNDLYFSREFVKDLAARGHYLQIGETLVRRSFARASMKAADMNVAPSLAFATKLASFNGGNPRRFEILPFGFDCDAFLNASQSRASRFEKKPGTQRLLYVSHYNYFRNFETLIRALPLIQTALANLTGDNVELALTTDIRKGAVYGGYNATSASNLIDKLGVRDRILMLGEIPYKELHSLYRTADVFVCPSYSESFGHPMLEAMASGTPVLAANLPVHREVCGDAAIYFDPFDEHELARECLRVLTDETTQRQLRTAANKQILQFSWDRHVEQLDNLIARLTTSKQAKR